MADWWLWAVPILVLVVAAWLLRRRVRGTRPSSGDIWWADVPYAGGQGSKVRPCLVLGRRRGGILVLKITSQDKSHRRDHLRIPTRRWDPRASRDSYLNLGEPTVVRPAAFQRRAGAADRTVRRLVAGYSERRTP